MVRDEQICWIEASEKRARTISSICRSNHACGMCLPIVFEVPYLRINSSMRYTINKNIPFEQIDYIAGISRTFKLCVANRDTH